MSCTWYVCIRIKYERTRGDPEITSGFIHKLRIAALCTLGMRLSLSLSLSHAVHAARKCFRISTMYNWRLPAGSAFLSAHRLLAVPCAVHPPSRCLSVCACVCVCAHSYSTLFRHPFACQGPLPLSQLHADNPLPHSQLSASSPHPVLRCLRGFFGASLVLSAPWLAFSRLVSLFRSLDFCLCPPPIRVPVAVSRRPTYSLLR